jgi:hypothetical protein
MIQAFLARLKPVKPELTKVYIICNDMDTWLMPGIKRIIIINTDRWIEEKQSEELPFY